ncbi:MAG: PAS domain-containing sensor histidine kinase [Flammeovirgaceae bacterium]
MIQTNNNLSSFLTRIGGIGIDDHMTIHQKRSIILNNILSQNDGIAFLVFGILLWSNVGWELGVFVAVLSGVSKFFVLLLNKLKLHLFAKIFSIFVISLIGGPLLFALVNSAQESLLVNIYFITMLVYAVLSFNWENRTEKWLSIIACACSFVWIFTFKYLDATFSDATGFVLDQMVVIFSIFGCMLNFFGYLTLQQYNLLAHKNLEHALRTLENTFALQKAVFDSVGAMIISTDVSGKITSFNQTAETLLGYSQDEVVNKLSPIVFHDPDEMADRVESISDCIHRKVDVCFDLLIAKTTAGLTNEEEWSFIRKEGSSFPVKVVTSALKHDDGTIFGFTFVATDISTRKQAEALIQAQHEELQASEEELRQNLEELQTTQDLLQKQQVKTEKLKERFELAIQGSSDGIWDWNITTDEIYYSPRWKSMLGYKVTEINNRFDVFEHLIHPEDKERVSNVLTAYLNNELDEYKVELRVKEKSGSYRWILSRGFALRDESGAPYRMTGSHSDIQEVKEKERLIQQKNEELSSSEEEIRQNSEELQAINEQLEAARAEAETAFLQEQRNKKKLEQALQELKEAQSQLIQAEKMSSLGQLTAGIAHEINNPLNFVFAGANTLKVILNDLFSIVNKYTELEQVKSYDELIPLLASIHELKNELYFEELEDDVRGLVDDILLGAQRTQKIIYSLRTFSRLDEDQYKRVDLIENIEATLTILNSQLANRIEVIKEYQPHLPSVECHIGQINQVFMNLISNAAQAIVGQGTIHIKLWTANQNVCFIQIKDSGIGMTPEDMNRIFDPFFTTKDVGEGTGLGLSIVHGILEKHQASIMVSSEVGKGSTFTIQLPISQHKPLEADLLQPDISLS